ncbi:hypothetical protein [Streptomyces sp. ALI-76-A]|jgi:hypothetical protein|uniref:hypothetical protein n=1 Tax=Streptomyces sp. ALI-76-A TaxID=3025736 RepID=UPI00256EF90D|nr:hypothetical protein [Streptomyces sp. ALI-76-A]MDL5204130.1 hypothetical protein [Streptomyces sp. ALI-76-A]
MTNRRVTASLLLGALGTLVGCSGADGAKEYDPPETLCGIQVDPELVAKLLPAGEEIEIEEKNPVPSRKRCQLNIDGKAALIASQEWWEKEDNIIDVADAHPQLESVQPENGERPYLYTGTGGVGRTDSCVSRDHPDQNLFTAIQVYGKGVDSSETMKKAITAYTQAVERSNACQ